MRFVIRFGDVAEGAAIRARNLADHLAFLEAHGDLILEAGPLADATGGPAGGLWIVEAGDRAAAGARVGADPFHAAGLRRSVTIPGCRRVFADGRRL